jgi:hypothetical protein
MFFALISIVVAGKLENPVRVDETYIVDVVSGALDNLVVDNPLRVYHAADGSRMQSKFLF